MSSDTTYSTSGYPLPFDPGERVLVEDADPAEAIEAAASTPGS